MLGTLIKPKSIIEKRLESTYSAVEHMRALGYNGRKYVKSFISNSSYSYDNRIPIAQTIRSLQKCKDLSNEFNIVERDESVKKKILTKSKDRYSSTDIILEIPLIFYTQLPAKIHTILQFDINNITYSAKAITPMPTNEALAQIRKHGKRFNHLELWWVPNDVLVEKIPDPDPIVVGVIKLPDDTSFNFELHRWVDESVEAEYWTKEGY